MISHQNEESGASARKRWSGPRPLENGRRHKTWCQENEHIKISNGPLNQEDKGGESKNGSV